MMLYMVGPDNMPVVRTPAQERQFRKDKASLYMRFEEEYHIWEDADGTWWGAQGDDKLCAESPFALAIVLGDHKAYHRRFSESGP